MIGGHETEADLERQQSRTKSRERATSKKLGKMGRRVKEEESEKKMTGVE